jgi:cell division protein FtsA
MNKSIITALDIGTTKISAVVAEINEEFELKILGVGIGPSAGLVKGVITNIPAAIEAISSAIERAEKTSGINIESAYVGIAGPHISSLNSQGIIAVADTQNPITEQDVTRAIESARIVHVPNNREIIHVVPRYYTLDGQDQVVDPVGMFASRLDVDAHVITASSSSINNLIQCIEGSGVQVESLVLDQLASTEAVIEHEELEHGVALCDIGGGTTDISVYVDGNLCHTGVIEVGGSLMTRDLIAALKAPHYSAEHIKREYGHVIPSMIEASELIELDSFGMERKKAIERRYVAEILQQRCEELFEMIRAEINRGSSTQMLSAGIVLTGGASKIKGMELLGETVLDMPVRIGLPKNLAGLSDILHDPAYSTSVGLLRWAMREKALLINNKPGQFTNNFVKKIASIMKIWQPQ